MSRSLVYARRLLAIGSVAALLGLLGGGCASGGSADGSSSGGSGGSAGGGAGTGNNDGSAGTGGSSGTGGFSGTGGTSGTGGSAGQAGADGGPDGSAGMAGAAGAAGMAGASGTAGGSGSGGASGAAGADGGSCSGCGCNKEVCNGLDDNCNGQIDEGNPGGGDPCTVPGKSGICAEGVKTCQNGLLVCISKNQPTAEKCNGLDDNCNGSVDEGNPESGGSCSTGLQGVCAFGKLSCQSGALVCVQNTQSSPEVCNGLDDNCDGQIDNNPTNPELGQACQVTGQKGVCAVSTYVCQGGQLLCPQVNQSSPEVCNNQDDNCDGNIDENLSGVPCQTGDPGVCATGTTLCSAGIQSCVPTVAPNTQPELCDGKDNNCNGTTDEDDPTTMCIRACPGGTSSLPHVTSMLCSNGSCVIGACASGWHDNNGNYCDGCENQACTQNPAVNNCGSAQAIAVGSQVTGQILNVNDAVWFKVTFSQPAAGSNFAPKVQLTQGATDYRMDVLSSCSATITCPASNANSGSGTGSDIDTWDMNFAHTCGGAYGPCSDSSTVPATIYVKVTRTQISGGGASPECNQFTVATSK